MSNEFSTKARAFIKARRAEKNKRLRRKKTEKEVTETLVKLISLFLTFNFKLLIPREKFSVNTGSCKKGQNLFSRLEKEQT